jgi:putative transposase
MTKKRTQYSMQFKFQVALEAAKGTQTINQIATARQLHPNQVSQWKRQLLEDGPALFQRANGRQKQQEAEQEAELYEQIGRLKMELEWLKKKATPFT